MNVAAGAHLADDEIIEESLFEHVSHRTHGGHSVPERVAFTEDLYSDVRQPLPEDSRDETVLYLDHLSLPLPVADWSTSMSRTVPRS